MVFNGVLVISVAKSSAEAWQFLACMPENFLTSEQLLQLIFCFPLQRFSNFALCFRTCFCFPYPSSAAAAAYNSYMDDSSDDGDSSSSSSGEDDEDEEDGYEYYYFNHNDSQSED